MEISVVPEGSSVPEQLARRAFAQFFFLERVCYPGKSQQPTGGSSTRPGILVTLRGGKPTVRGRADQGSAVLTAAAICRKEELLTNFGEYNENDYMEDSNVYFYEPFTYRPDADDEKLTVA